MKYGPLFRGYIRDYNHTPSANRCTKMPYKELKQMAKNLYLDVKEECNMWNDNNPLSEYMRMSKEQLPNAVWNALVYMYGN